MPTNTANYNLIKPGRNENVNIDQLNDNFDKIDTQMKSNEVKAKEAGGHEASATAPTNTKVLWIDTANNGITKYYDAATTTWKPVVTETVWN